MHWNDQRKTSYMLPKNILCHVTITAMQRRFSLPFMCSWFIVCVPQSILALSEKPSLPLLPFLTAPPRQSGKVGFRIKWRSLPIWIRSYSAEYKADLIPASTNWILEMRNRLHNLLIFHSWIKKNQGQNKCTKMRFHWKGWR